jgi:hypothetical protein
MVNIWLRLGGLMGMRALRAGREAMVKMVKVTMNLTQADAEAAAFIEKSLHTRSKAQAVSAALHLTQYIISVLQEDGDNELAFCNKADGSVKHIVVPQLRKAGTS